MVRFQDQVAIVTGGGTGIGFETASRLGGEGARVMIVDRDGERAEQAARALGARGIQTLVYVGDVGDAEAAGRSVSKAAAAWGRIDVLFNNAGIVGRVGNAWELSPEEMADVYRTNLRGVYLFCREVIPHMMERDYGRIVNMASVAGKEGNVKMALYSATKAAVMGLTKSVGKELAATGIKVNCLTPASVETRMLDGLTEERRWSLLGLIPMGRIGEVHEVAALACWLASSECSFSTGAAFDISGGRATY